MASAACVKKGVEASTRSGKNEQRVKRQNERQQKLPRSPAGLPPCRPHRAHSTLESGQLRGHSAASRWGRHLLARNERTSAHLRPTYALNSGDLEKASRGHEQAPGALAHAHLRGASQKRVRARRRPGSGPPAQPARDGRRRENHCSLQRHAGGQLEKVRRRREHQAVEPPAWRSRAGMR